MSKVQRQPTSQAASWWQTGIFYEVYLRSFKDSSGDGIGDLRGVLQQLDYLEWLGVTALWLTPFYPSPMKDFGYDISDYTAIHPMFGTMDDFEELVAAVHRRGMKLVIDFVPNHTSDQHPWFKESRRSVHGPKRDWYYWKDAERKDRPPNNWLGVLGGSAWEWDEQTGQFYYHAFLTEQPDLNLRNPNVQEAMLDVMRFWLDKGVDGFRVDVMWHLAKDEKWRDNPRNPNFKPSMPDCDQLLQVFSCDQPVVHEIVRRFRELLDTYEEKVLMGELYLSMDKAIRYYGAEQRGAQMPGNFQLLFLPWKAEDIGVAIDQYEAALPDTAWPNWNIGNHDRPRLISRIGEAQTSVAALLLLTLRGTPTLYYGDEIGMRNVAIPKDEIQDPQGLLMPGKNLSRDPIRTPMQWDTTTNSGFTTGKPWLRLDENWKDNNVEAQKKDPSSLLHFYRRVIALRQIEPSLYSGDYYPVITNGSLLAFIRKAAGSSSFLIVLNLTGEVAVYEPEEESRNGTIILSTHPAKEGQSFKKGCEVAANEGVIILLQSDDQVNQRRCGI